MPFIGTAAWSVPKTVANRFSQEGSGLSRYASLFNGVEINSTFYRRHKGSTFERWAASVPDGFQFSVKLPRDMTHTGALHDIKEAFHSFLDDIAPLGRKRGPLLCQLPPSLAFDPARIEAAFRVMRDADQGPIVIEARHKSWASEDAMALLRLYAIDRVLADPAPVWPIDDFAERPRYIRLHGKPKIYYSSYTHQDIKSFADHVASDSWCIFDNTASGAAILNALDMLDLKLRWSGENVGIFAARAPVAKTDE